MELAPRPERPRADLGQVRIESPVLATAPPTVDLVPRPERPRADLGQVRIESPVLATVPAPVELAPRPERPRADLGQVRIEDPALATVPAPVELPPRPEKEDRQPDEDRQREEKRQHEEKRQREEARTKTRFTHVHSRVMTDAEHTAAEISTARGPAPTRALCLAAQEALAEHAAGDRYTATPEVAGVPLAVGTLRQELEREILDILAVPEPRGARIPPPEPEAVAKLLRTVQDLAERRIDHAAVEEGLHLPRTEREPTTAAPAAEQPTPPASAVPAVSKASRADVYTDEKNPVRGADQGPGGVTSHPPNQGQAPQAQVTHTGGMDEGARQSGERGLRPEDDTGDRAPR